MATVAAASTSAFAPAGAATQAARDETKFGQDFNSFLTLLTSQLKFQDPMSPMDTTQFTSQLVQFTSVEQLTNISKTLETQGTAAANLFGDSSIVTPITGMLVMMSGTFACPLMLFDSLEQRFFKCTWLDNRAWAYSPLITVATAAATTP